MSDDRTALHYGLGHEQAIERVFVVRRKRLEVQHMRQLIPNGYFLVDQIAAVASDSLAA
jgi:hypothetical protein